MGFLHLLGVPVDLTAYPADDTDFPCPERKTGEEAPNIQHPVFRILGVDESDLCEHVLQVVVHALQFELVGEPGKNFFREGFHLKIWKI